MSQSPSSLLIKDGKHVAVANSSQWPGCTDDDESRTNTATTVSVDNTATTWIGEGQILTISRAGAAVTTEVLPVGDFLGAFGADPTTTGKPSETTSGPAATSSKPSMASAGVSFSKAGAAVMVGFALFIVLLQVIV